MNILPSFCAFLRSLAFCATRKYSVIFLFCFVLFVSCLCLFPFVSPFINRSGKLHCTISLILLEMWALCLPLNREAFSSLSLARFPIDRLCHLPIVGLSPSPPFPDWIFSWSAFRAHTSTGLSLSQTTTRLSLSFLPSIFLSSIYCLFLWWSVLPYSTHSLPGSCQWKTWIAQWL